MWEEVVCQTTLGSLLFVPWKQYCLDDQASVGNSSSIHSRVQASPGMWLLSGFPLGHSVSTPRLGAMDD